VREANATLDRTSALGPEDLESARNVLRRTDDVLGVLELARSATEDDDGLTTWVAEHIERRNQARANRDFATADAIRDELAAQGIDLEDTPTGTRWKRAR
jgi:cysteinyl-tRNA synthetase